MRGVPRRVDAGSSIPWRAEASGHSRYIYALPPWKQSSKPSPSHTTGQTGVCKVSISLASKIRHILRRATSRSGPWNTMTQHTLTLSSLHSEASYLLSLAVILMYHPSGKNRSTFQVGQEEIFSLSPTPSMLSRTRIRQAPISTLARSQRYIALAIHSPRRVSALTIPARTT